jgi:hypothetical protein
MTSFSSEEPLSERQSLDLIQTMIRQAQNRLTDDGSHLLWWGSLVLVAALGHYTLLQTTWAGYGGLAWTLMAVGWVGTVVIVRRQARQARANTFADRVMGSLWSCVGGSIGLVFLVVSLTHTWRAAYPMILLLYGIGLISTGAIVRFWPLAVGGAVCWGLMVVASLVHFEGQLLCMAGAVAAGFIVPGLLIRQRFNQENSRYADAARAV